MVGVGWPVVARLDCGQCLHPAEKTCVAFLLGSFAVYFGVYVIGTWWLNIPGMGVLMAVLAGAAVPGLRAMPWERFGAFLAAEICRSRANPGIALLWLVLIGVAASGLVQGLAPPNDYDSLMYQLSIPQYDVEAGRRVHAWALGASTIKTLFPEMMGHLSRVALTLAGAGAAQMIHGLFSLVAAGAAASIAWRCGASSPVAILAALLFLACRAVVWEMGSVEVDAPLGAYAGFALVVYLAWRNRPAAGLMAVFGLMIGGGILVKYHGFAIALAFAPLMALDLLRTHPDRRVNTAGFLALGAGLALIAVAPHLVRNFVQSGNPIFPLFNGLFYLGAPDFYSGTAASYGTGRSLLDLLIAPWTFSITPMQHYDGMVLGAPYLLAFAPLVLLRPDRGRAFIPALIVAAVYFIQWFHLLSQQVRFLLPIVPVLAAMAASGAHALWTTCSRHMMTRAAAIAVFVPFAALQTMFVGIYALIRVPPAVGLVSPADYHAKTPTLTGAQYATCMYIREWLKPGERYYSAIHPHSFYCPQVQAVPTYFDDEAKWWLKSATPPEMPFDEFLRRAEAMKFRFFIIPTGYEFRRNDTADAQFMEQTAGMLRFGAGLAPAFSALTPLSVGAFSSVYDGPEVIAWLKAHWQARPEPGR